MFGRRASDADVAAEIARGFPAAPDEVVAGVLGVAERPRRGTAEVEAWVAEQVLRQAARRCARDSGLEQSAYPPDGEDSLRVYLADDVADDDVHAVDASLWAQARVDAWSDHADALAAERELWWAEQAAPEVDELMASWRG